MAEVGLLIVSYEILIKSNINSLICDIASSIIQSDEAPLYIGYLAAEGSGDDSCLNRAACMAPDTTAEYLRAARAILKGAEMFDASFAYNLHYQEILQKTERAIYDGVTGAPCDAIYQCRL